MGNAEADCRTVLEKLYLYLDGELESSSVADIERHLDLCVECLEHVGFERDVIKIVGKKCRESQIPPGLAQQIRAKLREMF